MRSDSHGMTEGNPSDSELLLAIAGRDLDAVHELYQRHAPWLSIRLSKRCGDPDMVADALQDTFLAVWQKPSGYRGQGDVGAWLWGIAIRRLISRLRGRRTITLDAAATETVSPSAEEQVLVAVEYGDIGQALADLSPEMRAVVRAVVLDGLTTKEAARLLGMPESSVKTRLARAKVRLRTTLVEGM
jgi:RNA polymerase sigma factor (sigma-70 family)